MLEWRYLGMIAPMAPPRRLVTPRTTTVLVYAASIFRYAQKLASWPGKTESSSIFGGG